MKSGFARSRLSRLGNLLGESVERGDVPGLVALLDRRGETHVEAHGDLAFGAAPKMRRDTIFRIASMTKPIVAAAAMTMVEEGRLRLDEPVDNLLPELADRKVLKNASGALDDTVPAHRSITLRDLLTFRLGIGAVMVFPAKHPIQKAMDAAGISPGPFLPDISADEYMRRLGNLPLIHQPGERWMYHVGAEVLGVLLARTDDRPLETVLRDRIFDPLGMKDTGFHVPAGKLKRLSSAYMSNENSSRLDFFDDAKASRWSKPPVFESGGGGLVSTADDYLSFCRMMLAKGRPMGTLGRKRVLSRPAVDLMTADQLQPTQKEGAEIFFGDARSWGMGLSVTVRRTELWETPGRFGWDGGYGTSGYSDPEEELVGILLTQRIMESPLPPRVYTDFWNGAYQAIDD